MANETANIAILKDAYGKWIETKGGSVDHWMSIIDDNIDFQSLARGAPKMTFAKEYSKREQLGEYFAGLAKDWSMVRISTDEFVAQGNVVVMRGSCAWTNKHTGKVVEYHEYYDTAAVYEAATK